MTDTATIRAIKGFEADLSCRGHKFEVGQTYTATGEIVACKNGFHAVPDDQHPLAVFNYYPPARSRFCIVEVGGKTDSEGDKVAAEILSVGKEVGLRELTLEAVTWVTGRATLEGPVAVKTNGLATASGTHGAATASGTRGAATASGTQGAATASGEHGAATASGYRGAATASGEQGAATASGHQGAATASGEQGCAIGSGPGCRVMGEVDGVDLFAREFSWTGAEWRRVSIACGTTGLGGIRAGVWYRCVGGALVEADQ
jgi:hypothetical protein